MAKGSGQYVTPVDADGDFINDVNGLPVKMADSASLDAFSRMRVSNPSYVFDTNFQYNLQPIVWEAVVTDAQTTVTHDATNRCALMTFNGADNGNAYMQTYEWFRYQAGRSQMVFITFNFIETATNVTKFAGYSDGNNGVELRQTGTAVSLNLLSDTEKGDESVAQANWNIDPLDGTGASGVTLNLTKTHILVIDFQWLGVGRIRVGFDVGGVLYYVHEFVHANVQTVPYMQTANLPIRVGMIASGAATTTMRFICASVSSEGGQEDVGGFSIGLEGTGTAGNTARAHIMSVRPKTTFNSIGNRTKFVLEDIEVYVTGNSAVYWELCVGQAISGTTTFADVNATYSAFEYNTAGTISGAPAITILSGYVVATAQSKTAIQRPITMKYPITLNAAGQNYANGTLSLVATGLTAASAMRVALHWREIR